MPLILAFISKYIPTKDMVIGAVVIGLMLLSWHFYDKYQSAVNYATMVKAESVQALAAANKTIADDKASYQSNLLQVQQSYDKSQQDNAASRASDNQRWMQFASTLGKANPLFPGATSSGGQLSDAQWASIINSMGTVSLNLASSLRQDDDLLTACRTERSSLTGK